MKIYKPTPAQITAWVDKHFESKPRKDGTELRICNPFDGDEGYHFNISVHKASCHDWRGDEWAGPKNPKTGKRQCTFLKFVCKFLNCSYHEAARAISAAAGSAVAYTAAGYRVEGSEGQDGPKEAKEKPLVELPPGSEPIIGSKQRTTAGIVANWLESRGVSKELSILHNIHHIGAEVVFPYYEFGTLVYWQTRSSINKIFRFPDQKQFGVNKSEFIYNFDGIEPATYVIVAEAIFGALTLGAQACATGGADMGPMQVRKLKLLGPRDGIILAPDNDVAGLKSVLRNGQLLAAAGLSVSVSVPPKIAYRDTDGSERLTKDWNELYTGAKMSLSDIRDVFEDGVVPLDTKTRMTLAGFVTGNGKVTLQQAATKLLR